LETKKIKERYSEKEEGSKNKRADQGGAMVLNGEKEKKTSGHDQ